jgi:hypothetical protein
MCSLQRVAKWKIRETVDLVISRTGSRGARGTGKNVEFQTG